MRARYSGRSFYESNVSTVQAKGDKGYRSQHDVLGQDREDFFPELASTSHIAQQEGSRTFSCTFAPTRTSQF